MYHFSEKIYTSLAESLLSALVYPCYFTGAVEVEAGSADVRLVATLIIHRHAPAPFSGETDYITHVVPVWWECSVVDSDGAELEHDFDFERFVEFVKAL